MPDTASPARDPFPDAAAVGDFLTYLHTFPAVVVALTRRGSGPRRPREVNVPTLLAQRAAQARPRPDGTYTPREQRLRDAHTQHERNRSRLAAVARAWDATLPVQDSAPLGERDPDQVWLATTGDLHYTYRATAAGDEVHGIVPADWAAAYAATLTPTGA